MVDGGVVILSRDRLIGSQIWVRGWGVIIGGGRLMGRRSDAAIGALEMEIESEIGN